MTGLDYRKLANAGNEKVTFYKRPAIQYPGTETVDWYGFKRHNFEVAGHKAFIVEPPNPAPGYPWSWCLQWEEAFVPRTPALKLLERGFHHVHVDVFESRMNPEGIRIAEEFYALLQSLKFHPKAALIGMSMGGLFSLRWAAEHPETVGAMYLDAPVCRIDNSAMHDPANPNYPRQLKEQEVYNRAYGCANAEEAAKHPLSPINNYMPIAKAHVPILVIQGGQDQSVLPQYNIDLFAERFQAAGGEIEIIRQEYNGHHPHGFDNPQPLVDFILQHYPEL